MSPLFESEYNTQQTARLSQQLRHGLITSIYAIPYALHLSTQVSCIMNAIREKRSELDFLGEIVSFPRNSPTDSDSTHETKLIPAVGSVRACERARV